MPKHEPERTCLVTREALPASDLLRFALGPDGTVVPDLRGRLPGRGAWVTPTRVAVETAARRRLFSRAFKTEAAVSPTLADDVDAMLVRDVAGALSLANKAGAVVAGFGKVEAALAGGTVGALIHAREAAEDGRRKLAAALRKHGGAAIYGQEALDDLSGDDLDVALGRVHVIHAALLVGPGSQGCWVRWRRLRDYRAVGSAARPARGMDRGSDEGPGGRTETV